MQLESTHQPWHVAPVFAPHCSRSAVRPLQTHEVIVCIWKAPWHLATDLVLWDDSTQC